MDDRLIDDGTIPLHRRSLLPGEGFFTPDSFDETVAEREAEAALSGADRVVVADPDADGLGCVALLRVAFGNAALLPAGPHEIDDAFEYVEAYGEPGVELYVCDLCPDAESDIDALPAVAEVADTVRWFDHHQWDDALADAVAATLDAVAHEFDERYVDLAAVTRDHDLWLREDPRSDDLADYAYWAEPEEYIGTVLEHGADLPDAVGTFLEERRVEKEALIEKAVDRADFREIGEWTVGVTYGRCSQNEVAEAMREAGADASVIVKPAGSASIRGTDSFQRCHEVAARVNGGGHPKAAGCKPDIYDDMLDYAHHWSTRGAVTKQVILEAFGALDPEADTEA